MKVLVALAKGFETMEFSVFIDVMGWSRNDFQVDIKTVTCGFSKEVVSTFNVPIIVDTLIADVDPTEYDALAIPGGFEEYGFYTEAYHPAFLDLIRAFEQAGKPIASVCVAALALGKSGILHNRRATTYHLDNGLRQNQLAVFCPQVVNEPVVLDQNVITSYCPETAVHVAFQLLALLTNKEQMEQVKTAMGY